MKALNSRCTTRVHQAKVEAPIHTTAGALHPQKDMHLFQVKGTGLPTQGVFHKY